MWTPTYIALHSPIEPLDQLLLFYFNHPNWELNQGPLIQKNWFNLPNRFIYRQILSPIHGTVNIQVRKTNHISVAHMCMRSINCNNNYIEHHDDDDYAICRV